MKPSRNLRNRINGSCFFKEDGEAKLNTKSVGRIAAVNLRKKRSWCRKGSKAFYKSALSIFSENGSLKSSWQVVFCSLSSKSTAHLRIFTSSKGF